MDMGVLPFAAKIRQVTSKRKRKEFSFVGVCIANAGAWLGAGIFLGICYYFVMKRMVRDKEAYETTRKKSMLTKAK